VTSYDTSNMQASAEDFQDYFIKSVQEAVSKTKGHTDTLSTMDVVKYQGYSRVSCSVSYLRDVTPSEKAEEIMQLKKQSSL